MEVLAWNEQYLGTTTPEIMFCLRFGLQMEPSSLRGKDNIDKVRILSEAFVSFSGAATKFERHYHKLESRVKELDVELKNKNSELEKNLKEKEEVKNHLHDILESLPTGLVVIDLRGKIVTFNRAAENITGLTAEKVTGRDLDKVFDLNLFQNSQIDLKSLVNVRENREVETQFYRNGKDALDVSLWISPMKDTQGYKVGVVLTLQDITRMKKLEKQANRTGRLAAMGEMAVNIAHEIRNPLGSIELLSTLLRKELEDFEEQKTLAEHISSGVKSINNIVSNLLLFIKPQKKIGFQIIDLLGSLDNTLLFPSHLISVNPQTATGPHSFSKGTDPERNKIGSNGSIEVVKSYCPKPLLVNGDSELLKQVFLNIILNAIQAMPGGGKLTISAREVDDRQKGQKLAKITFGDTGLGISRENMGRIFDPFFTTKKRGTGLGLAIVHNIMKAHCGTIDINSREGEGTECIITLPSWKGKKADTE
ncbi:MAG: ATP-binding protein [Thermodesulfobacteriota bacterium]|nr:ATP-binding protein [Thermodesulfobacteriota bacterium]